MGLAQLVVLHVLTGEEFHLGGLIDVDLDDLPLRQFERLVQEFHGSANGRRKDSEVGRLELDAQHGKGRMVDNVLGKAAIDDVEKAVADLMKY